MQLRAPVAAHLVATLVVAAATVVAGCDKAKPAEQSAADAGMPPSLVGLSTVRLADGGRFEAVRIPDDAGPLATGIPVPVSKVESAVNPEHLAKYAGPVGIVEGLIKASGDAAPKQDIDIPFKCGEAYATYGKAFREGNGRALADVMVAVTGYQGFVPAASEVVNVKIHGCAFDRRTVVLTYGQHIEVANTDTNDSFLPTLDGAQMAAQMAALPHGDVVKLYPNEVGHYLLRDDAGHPWMKTDVFALRYATHAVTGLDGRYRIAGIPAGKVKISMYLPAVDEQLHPDHGIADVTQEREVEVKAGETVQVDFELKYKTPKPRPKPKLDPNRPIIK